VQGDGFPVLLFAPGFLSSRIERWWTNPDKPGVPQGWTDPIPVLSERFRVISLDVRNAGESRAPVGPTDGWHSYTDDHLALLDHLGVAQCHVVGACIGVSFALSLVAARAGLVTSLVLQNPIGLVADNRAAIDEEYDKWAATVAGWPGIDAALLPDFGKRMFGGSFIFSVSEDVVAGCDVPILLMPGDDLVHPAGTAAEIARLAPHAEVMDPWKGVDIRDESMRKVRDFLLRHTPRDS
jgi:pimeloyl-ACP methyl ester carboxylesterase